MAASRQKVWTENGPEQRELNRMFESNSVDESTLPNKVRLSSETFMAFPAKTFAAHFRKTKAKYGAYAKSHDVPAENSIPELAGSGGTSVNKRKRDDEDYQDDSEEPQISFVNPPFMTWIHYDNREKVDMVSVVVPVVSGSEDVDFVLSEDGMKLVINYTWPTLVVVPRVLFCRRAQSMPLSHPRINSMSAELVKREISERTKPCGSIVVRLPIKVQREVGTWEYEGLRMNNTDAILFQFRAYQAKAVIQDAVTKVDFV